MANGMTHSVVGGLFGLAVSLIDVDEHGCSVHNPILATTVGTLFGKLPDILEPALKNPHHRQFFHSVTVLLALGYGLKRAYEWKPEGDAGKVSRCFMLCAGTGYLSHLLLDATTPRSLPLLGKL